MHSASTSKSISTPRSSRTGTREPREAALREPRRSERRSLLALLEAARRAPSSRSARSPRRTRRLVRKIAAQGHEIACHGDRHESVYALTPAEFRADIRRAKRRLEDLRRPVIGYRAPNFSIGPCQSWAYEILMEEGLPLRLEHLSDPPRPLRPAERAAIPVRHLPQRPGLADGVSDRHRARAGDQFADRRRRLLPPVAVRADPPRHSAREHARAAAGDVLFPPVGARSRTAAPADVVAAPVPPLRRPRDRGVKLSRCCSRSSASAPRARCSNAAKSSQQCRE
jgi:hypothetical protein